MKFNQTLMYSVLRTPFDYTENNCFYRVVLISPFLLALYIVGIPLALVVDLCFALGGVEE